MYTRILFTNGHKTIKLMWVLHRGTDVVYGFYGDRGHRTYHASGRHHETNDDGGHSNVRHQVPLAELRGVVPLTSLNFDNTSSIFQSVVDRTFDSRKRRSKSDAILMVDSRSIPDDRQVMIWIGLLEAGNGSALTDFLAQRKAAGTMIDSHILVAVGKTPWVWASLSWLNGSLRQDAK